MCVAFGRTLAASARWLEVASCCLGFRPRPPGQWFLAEWHTPAPRGRAVLPLFMACGAVSHLSRGPRLENTNIVGKRE